MSNPDVIDQLVGIDPGSPLDAIRARRPAARENAQTSYTALFQPKEPGGVSLADRFSLALFIAGLHRDASIAAFYRASLADAAGYDAVEAIDSEGSAATAEGPYGIYPDGPLTSENRLGLIFRAGEGSRRVLGPKLAAALEHAHLLVFRPRDASSAALQALLDAGWTTTDIVTISQLVAFLSFQIRVVHGLRALAASQSGAGYSTTAVAAE